MVGNISGSIAGLVGGFQAAKGALSLMGVESENVEKAIQKMQASMAIVQGLNAVVEGQKQFRKLTAAVKAAGAGMSGFKKALIATGLGALVIVLGEIIAHFDEISQWLDNITG